jgi:hypothetical protein
MTALAGPPHRAEAETGSAIPAIEAAGVICPVFLVRMALAWHELARKASRSGDAADGMRL